MAGDASYILKVRVASPRGLEDLLQEIRAAANVSTHTTIVLSTPFENRPPHTLHVSGCDGEQPSGSTPCTLDAERDDGGSAPVLSRRGGQLVGPGRHDRGAMQQGVVDERAVGPAISGRRRRQHHVPLADVGGAAQRA